MHTVDLSPLLNYGLEAIGMILLALASWATLWLKNKFKIDVDDKTRAYLTDAIDNAIQYAVKKTEAAVDPLAKIQVKDARVSAAADYLVAHVPDALAHFKVTPDALERLIIAKLPQA